MITGHEEPLAPTEKNSYTQSSFRSQMNSYGTPTFTFQTSICRFRSEIPCCRMDN